jgi:hypothetical protein
MHSAPRAVYVLVHLCVLKTSEKKEFPFTFFRITEEDTDPVVSGCINQFNQESGFGFNETAPEKKYACGLLRTANQKLEKK